MSEKHYSATEVVTALYEALLLRSPDREGLASAVAAHNAGRWGKLSDAIKSTIASREFAQSHAEFFHRNVKTDLARFTNDASQFGEVGLLLKRIVNANSAHRFVVDVGARGRMRSNSYDLMRHFGWSGLLIEANPRLIDAIQKEFSGLDFTLLNLAVSDHAGSATFFIGVNDDVSSLDEKTAQGWGNITGKVEVTVAKLGDVLIRQKIPYDFDLLSIDIEGEDVKVLNNLIRSSSFRPKWVIVEVPHQSNSSFENLNLSEAVKSEYKIFDQTRSNLLLELNT